MVAGASFNLAGSIIRRLQCATQLWEPKFSVALKFDRFPEECYNLPVALA